MAGDEDVSIMWLLEGFERKEYGVCLRETSPAKIFSEERFSRLLQGVQDQSERRCVLAEQLRNEEQIVCPSMAQVGVCHSRRQQVRSVTSCLSRSNIIVDVAHRVCSFLLKLQERVFRRKEVVINYFSSCLLRL